MRTIEGGDIHSLAYELWNGGEYNEEVATSWKTLHEYALLILATETPIDRAIAYLKDTGSPESATGRLLMRAAERAFRAAGDTEEDEE